MSAAQRTAVVIGVGLIGGSFALALKRSENCRVIGLGRGAANVTRALQLGVIDAIADGPAELAQADIILISTPVGQMPAVMADVNAHARADAIITDAGSTKRDVVACARRHLPRLLTSFVPAHPIAGAETSGVAAARADLFDARDVILTALPETLPEALERGAELWRACGARVSEMPPELHDRVFAAVSHLPHALAFALVDMLANRANSAQLFNFAGAGFRDFTRIASSSPEMWRDICIANRDALALELGDLQRHLASLAETLARGDAAMLEQIFSNARQARQDWLQRRGYGHE